jgi:hypothetical protein
MKQKLIFVSSGDYNTPPSKVQLWRSLPTRMMYQTFQSILHYLEASNKIMFDGRRG